jgi:hypothetical protein
MYNRNQYPRSRGAGGPAGAGSAANGAAHGRIGSNSVNGANNNNRYSDPQRDPPNARLLPGSTAGPGQDKYERFESWLRENGAEFDLVRCSLIIVCAVKSLGSDANIALHVAADTLEGSSFVVLS